MRAVNCHCRRGRPGPPSLPDCSRPSSRRKPNHVRAPLTGRAQIHLDTWTPLQRSLPTSAPGHEPRFAMCALSGRWANRARAGNGGLQAKSRIHTIGHKRSFQQRAEISRNQTFEPEQPKCALKDW